MAAKAPGVTVICELGVSGLVRVDIDAIIDVAGESYIVETKMTKVSGRFDHQFFSETSKYGAQVCRNVEYSLSEGKRSPTFLPFARRL